jgi:hypothetical protein
MGQQSTAQIISVLPEVQVSPSPPILTALQRNTQVQNDRN